MPIYDLTCVNKHIQRDLYLRVGERPACPECGEPTETLWGTPPNVVGDDIPGGVWIKHGLVNEDGSPMKFYSKSEIAREAKKRGLEPFVRHVPERGSDRSKHTVRWV